MKPMTTSEGGRDGERKRGRWKGRDERGETETENEMKMKESGEKDEANVREQNCHNTYSRTI